MSLYTPEGEPAGTLDKIVLLNMWANHLLKQKRLNIPKMIFAGMGKPTFPINSALAKAGINYWKRLLTKSQRARYILKTQGSNEKTRSKIGNIHAVIGYDADSQGNIIARTRMAAALTRWYKHDITANNILFTVGALSALNCIFELINQITPLGKIITPFPYYSRYPGKNNQNKLHPINVMQEKGYLLTAHILEKSIREAKKDKIPISAFLFCDPNNPLGTVVGKSEWHKIAKVLKPYSSVPIILDEAYAEMCFEGKHCSLLQIEPTLKNRLIVIRSATKALSVAGERMAIMMVFNKKWIVSLSKIITNEYVHAPVALQFIYADTMYQLKDKDLRSYVNFYQPQVEYVSNYLKKLHASLPDANHKIKSTFYVIANLSSLIGLDLPPETKQALGKTGKIKTDEDIAYYLLFAEGIMLAPLSYFGLDPTLGYLRITCSGGDEELKTLLHRLEKKLIYARSLSHTSLNY